MNIKKHIKEREVKIPISAHIREDLYLKVKNKIKKDKITLRKLIEASFLAYLEE